MTNDDATDLVKIGFELEADAPTAMEGMWARPVGEDVYLIENSPFYAYGISYRDKVFARRAGDGALEFSSVAERGGHSTYRVFLVEPRHESESFGRYWSQLEQMGCTYEGASERLLSIDVPPDVDVYAVYTVLEQGQAAGIWEFEEAHVGHKLRR